MHSVNRARAAPLCRTHATSSQPRRPSELFAVPSFTQAGGLLDAPNQWLCTENTWTWRGNIYNTPRGNTRQQGSIDCPQPTPPGCASQETPKKGVLPGRRKDRPRLCTHFTLARKIPMSGRGETVRDEWGFLLFILFFFCIRARGREGMGRGCVATCALVPLLPREHRETTNSQS